MIDEKTRDAERQMIGCCLTSTEALDDVLEVLDSGDLWNPHLATILEACTAVAEEGQPVEPLTVAEKLGPDSLKRVGGLSELITLTSLVVTTSSAGYYAAEIVKPAAILRRVQAAGHRLAALVAEGGEGVDPLAVVDQARAELDAVATGRATTADVRAEVYEALEMLETPEAGTPTPWRDLTQAIGGWHPGNLYYVGARPQIGKSVVGVAAALDMARRGKHAHVASLEMSKAELYHRMLSSVGGVDNHQMLHRKLGQPEWSRLGTAAEHIAGLPLSVDDSGTQRIADIRAKARALARTGNLGMIVLDYMQLMSSGKRVESRQQEVSEFSRALKLLAKEFQVPVVALSQLNRGSEHRVDKMPQLSDLRESGSLEQDADCVLLLHRDQDSPDLMQILVAKNRHGPNGVLLRLVFEGQYSRLTDFTPIYGRQAS